VAHTAVAGRFVAFMLAMVSVLALSPKRRHERNGHTVVTEFEQETLAGRGRHVSGRDERTQHDAGQQDR